jgi:hypothetical protein
MKSTKDLKTGSIGYVGTKRYWYVFRVAENIDSCDGLSQLRDGTRPPEYSTCMMMGPSSDDLLVRQATWEESVWFEACENFNPCLRISGKKPMDVWSQN